MYVPKHKRSFTALLALTLPALLFISASAQTKRNNPYSPSPSGAVASIQVVTSPTPAIQPLPQTEAPVKQIAFVLNDKAAKNSEQPPNSQKAVEVLPVTTSKPLRALTEIYLIAPGDVLFINLKNSPHGTGRFLVRNDGTIDYGLAGANVIAAGLTVDGLAATLHSAIKLYADPQVEVKVQEHGSHAITVTGLVNNPGEKNLRREAMPLFALKVDSEVRREAAIVSITRGGTGKVESYDLTQSATDNTLIYPGDHVMFTTEKVTAKISYYYINGEVASSGRRELTDGMRLLRAMTMARPKAEAKRIVIKRPNENGITVLEYDMRAVKTGKIADPILTPGDIIEVKN